jgi:hypothetical protein
MVINQSMKGQRRPLHVPQRVAKAEIKKIIDANPAFRSAVDNLVAHSTEARMDKKREKSVNAVYTNNPAFKREVDDALALL